MPDQLPSKELAAAPVPLLGAAPEDANNPKGFALDPEDGAPATETETPETPEQPKFIEDVPDDVDIKVKSRTFADFKRSEDPPVEETKAVDKDPNVRTLDDIDEADRKVFKSMSNESYNRLKPIYLEHKKLRQEIEERRQELERVKAEKLSTHPTLYEHPQGFVLNDDYQKLYFDATVSSQLQDHWERQLINIRRGIDWAPAEFDPKTGQIAVGEKRASDADAEAIVLRNVNQSQRQAIQFANKLDTYVQEFNTKQKKEVEGIKQNEEKFFPGYDDEKHPTKKIQREVLDALGSFRSSPLASMLAKSAATNVILSQRLQAIEAEMKAIKETKEDAKKAPPSRSKIRPNATGGYPTSRKFSDWEAIRSQG